MEMVGQLSLHEAVSCSSRIFIVEGLITVFLRVFHPFILLDSPQTARFLAQDGDLVLQRLRTDYNNGAKDQEAFKWKYLWETLTDWKIYFSVVVFWENSITGYGFIYTLPTVIRDLGYSATNAQLLTIPIYVVALVCVLITAYYADRMKNRAPFIIYPYSVCAMGLLC